MRRRLFNILVGLSLAVFVAVVVASVRSFWVHDELDRATLSQPAEAKHELRSVVVDLYRGRIAVTFARFTATTSTQISNLSLFFKAFERGHRLRMMGPGMMYPQVQGNALGRIGDWLGFGVSHGIFNTRTWERVFPIADAVFVSVPAWFLALLSAILPGLWFRSTLRRRSLKRRRQLGRCPTCGYDLRAHNPGQKCPECGWSIPADFPRPNSGAVEQAKDGRDIPSQT